MHYLLKRGGTRYKRYVGSDYCPKCGLWGIKEIVITQIGNREVTTFKHQEYIAGKKFTVSRCYCWHT